MRGLLVVLAAATACSGAASPSGEEDLTGPLTALPACQAAPDPALETAPAGMAAPPGVVLLGGSEQGPVANAFGYVELTPIQVRLDYEAREDVSVLHSEDEVFESELLVSDGTHRTFVRASAICDRGSNLLLVVAPEAAPEGLPEPRAYGS